MNQFVITAVLSVSTALLGLMQIQTETQQQSHSNTWFIVACCSMVANLVGIIFTAIKEVHIIKITSAVREISGNATTSLSEILSALLDIRTRLESSRELQHSMKDVSLNPERYSTPIVSGKSAFRL